MDFELIERIEIPKYRYVKDNLVDCEFVAKGKSILRVVDGELNEEPITYNELNPLFGIDKKILIGDVIENDNKLIKVFSEGKNVVIELYEKKEDVVGSEIEEKISEENVQVIRIVLR